jgi:chaperone required for assembly of F1-ATPase
MTARFYKQVDAVRRDDGFVIHLDGRPIKTPAKALLMLPTPALANAIADEWAMQNEKIAAETMPLTRLANTAIDGVAGHRAAVAAAILKFGRHDLLCYRAEAPAALAERQRAAWNPHLLWLAARHGAKLDVTVGVAAIDQPEAALAALARALEAYGAFALTALHVLASVTGSLTLGLALAEGRIDADTGFALSRLDEDFQAEKWGRDAQATARAALLQRELGHALEFLTLART